MTRLLVNMGREANIVLLPTNSRNTSGESEQKRKVVEKPLPKRQNVRSACSCCIVGEPKLGDWLPTPPTLWWENFHRVTGRRERVLKALNAWKEGLGSDSKTLDKSAKGEVARLRSVPYWTVGQVMQRWPETMQEGGKKKERSHSSRVGTDVTLQEKYLNLLGSSFSQGNRQAEMTRCCWRPD